MHLAYARASFLLLCISLPSPGGNCHPAFAGVSFQPPCIPLPTAGGNLHATSAGAIFQPLCIPLPTAGGNWFNWHQTLAGSCFQYLCISPPTAGSNLQKRFMNSDTLWHVPMLLLAKLPAEHLQALPSKQSGDWPSSCTFVAADTDLHIREKASRANSELQIGVARTRQRLWGNMC